MRNGKTLVVALVAITASLLLASVASADLVIDEFNDDSNAWLISQMDNFGETTSGGVGYFYGETNEAMPNGPMMRQDIADFAAADYTHVVIKMSHEVGTEGTKAWIYWQRPGDTNYVGKGVAFDITTDGEYHEYTVDVSSNVNWNGDISWIRVDPVRGSTTAGNQFKIDYIRVVPEPATMVLLGLGGVGLLVRRRRRA